MRSALFDRFVLRFAASLALLASGAANAETRVALVVGQSAYQNVAKLPNPIRDATAIAASLRRVGFTTVTLRSDLDKAGLEAALQGFASIARSADVAMVYYAGHGVEVGGTNYLVPVGARLSADSDVQFEAVSLDLVLSAVGGARQLKMVVLDACRDNPFLVGMKRSGGTRSVGRGLARVEPDAGTLVAYAAREGSVAADGDGRNSPFTEAFVRNLETPGLEIRLMFGKIHDDVYESTNRRQQPATYASLGGRPFYFVPGTGSAVPVAAPLDPRAVELSYWNSIATSTDAALFRDYLKAYPSGAFANIALSKIATFTAPKPQPIAPPVAVGSGIDGAWQGVYRYASGGQKPVQFGMMLSASGSRVTGSVSEPNTFGNASAPFLSATISGTLRGQEISFVKTYDGTGGVSHSISYVGTLDAASRTIRGSWGAGAGTFELRLKD